jgi:hypothetical protein
MLVYGEPGEGKTPFLATVVEAPTMMPALLIDGDSGTLSIREVKGLATVHLSEMATKEKIDEWSALERMYSFLKFAKHDFKTVLLDGGTDIEKACENNILSNMTGDRAGRDQELAELSDYRRIQERMKRMYMRFRDIVTVDGRRMNFISTAHEAKGKHPITQAVTIQPMFLGKGAVIIPALFDIVARLVTEEDKDKKQVKYLVPSLEGRTRGRDRSRALGAHLQDPTMKKIAELIFSKQEALNAHS